MPAAGQRIVSGIFQDKIQTVTISSSIKRLLVIIGSAKAGTTALSHHLRMHPQMIMGIEKEPKFFTNFADQSWSGPAIKGFKSSLIADMRAYEENFPGLVEGKWAIDASTDYIWSDDTPTLLERFAQDCDVRLIAVLRDPVDRAVSEYNHTVRNHFETLSFSEAVEAESERYRQGWHPLFYHMRRSTVRKDVHRFHEIFGDRFLVVDYAELQNAEALMDRLYGLLDLEPVSLPSVERKNESYLPRNQVAHRMLKSEKFRAFSRMIVPTPLRRAVWRKLHTNSRNVKTVGQEEREMFRLRLEKEIALCVHDPLIPTDNWSCTRG